MTDQRPTGYSPRLHNHDLGPVPQKWTWYNILAFWMSDVHSVGGYVFAASLFALGLASWQVLIALLVLAAYSGLVFGFVPVAGVSFESHIAGALAGVCVAWLMHSRALLAQK
ncbi:Cytosine/purine uracil thiaminee allantoin permease [Pseudomonas syringae pv. aceris]|uniref:rhomboid family intramembrane serine protease n=1 Tax=Pseudomonas syringae TaxID=317 RepID=UPI000F40F65F|nr:rhomboid family intramembrane serine protease [Pseudomonas syringae]RMS70976.1 Cytosine/purine uracil thiaminee allantoin permease [Pseudomonas syringae pv. aceris]